MSGAKTPNLRSRPPMEQPRRDAWSFIDVALWLVLFGAACYFGAHVAAWILRMHHG